MSKLIPEVATLKESFNIIKDKNTLIERECALLQEASRFDIPLEKYEKLFEIYIKHKLEEPIIDLPPIDVENMRVVLKR